MLASSLDYEETLDQVAQLAVRELADLCVVDIVSRRRRGPAPQGGLPRPGTGLDLPNGSCGSRSIGAART